jgi:FkbM family methyltransferase
MATIDKALPPISPGGMTPDALRKLVIKSNPVILEIGANRGMHTQMFLQLFPDATIYAFEPDPRAVAAFKARVSSPRVTLFEGAIGASDGEATFHVSSGLPPDFSPMAPALYPMGWDQSGSLHAPKTHRDVWPWCKFESTISVPVRSLDSWAAEAGIGRVDLLWADVQGAEGDLIAGGGATLKNTRHFYTEYSNDELYEGQITLPQIIGMLKDFVVLHRFSTDVLFRNSRL